jgi:probable HAF family extracellular repeat protein
VATGINDSGVIVGYTGDLRVHGFLYDGVSFASIRHANDTATFTVGINDDGVLVGGTGSVFSTTGFKLRSHRFQKIQPPGNFIYVFAMGINRYSQVVGWADDDAFTYSRDAFRLFRIPGSDVTKAWGINDNGVVVGWYGVGASTYGFVLQNGKYASLAYPGAKGTLARGINASGQVVGEYTYDDRTFHGFVTSPITDAVFQEAGK